MRPPFHDFLIWVVCFVGAMCLLFGAPKSKLQRDLPHTGAILARAFAIAILFQLFLWVLTDRSLGFIARPSRLHSLLGLVRGLNTGIVIAFGVSMILQERQAKAERKRLAGLQTPLMQPRANM